MGLKPLNIVLYDWFSMTSKIDSVDSLLKLIGLENETLKFQPCKGMHGYKDRLSFSGINIHFNGREDMGIWLEMSGQGCRAFETYSNTDWSVLFYMVVHESEDYHLTRLDVAYDDKDGVLSLDKLYKETEQQNYTSKFSSYQLTKSNNGITVYFGSVKSNVLLRFYDKAKERGLEDGTHWVRCEFQLRDDKALNFIKLTDTIGKNFFGVLNNYIRFVVHSAVYQDNKYKLKTAKWWSKFLESVAKVSIYTPCDLDYNLERLDNYTFNLAGNAVNTAIKIHGIEEFIRRLAERSCMPNKKYKHLEDVNGVVKDDPVIKFLKERGAL